MRTMSIYKNLSRIKRVSGKPIEGMRACLGNPGDAGKNRKTSLGNPRDVCETLVSDDCVRGSST
jgi:hypothetical protein